MASIRPYLFASKYLWMPARPHKIFTHSWTTTCLETILYWKGHWCQCMVSLVLLHTYNHQYLYSRLPGQKEILVGSVWGGKKLHMRHVRLHIRKGCDPHYLAAGNSLIDAYRNPPLGLSHCSRFSMCVIRYLRYRERAVNRTATSHSYRTTLNTQETSVSNGPCATALHAADQHPCGTPATAFDICARKATKNGWTTLLRLLSGSTQLSLAPYHL